MIQKALLNSNNEVINIAVFDDTSIDDGWIPYTDTNPAYIGGLYVEGYFYPPQPFTSWTKNKGIWEPPIPMPKVRCQWNESTLSWDEY